MSNDPINVIDEKCVGCTLCTKACPFGAIEMDASLAVIDLTKCTVCGACVEACNFDAITISEREIAMAAENTCWVSFLPIVARYRDKGFSSPTELKH